MTIYNPSGGIIIDAPITKEAVEKFVLMGDWYVLLPFMSLSVLDIPEGSYINYKGKKWEIMAPVYPESSGTGYSYSLQFDDQQNKLKKSICFWLGGPNPEAVFSDTTDLTSFGNLIVANMNRELGSEIWEFGGLVNVDNQETVKVVSFSGDTCWDAVNNIANAFDCEWWTEQNGGKVYLFFGKLERGSDEIFKEGDVISQMPARKSNNDDGYGTRFYVFGSTRNLTSDYGQADQGGATNHVSEIRLRLPNNQQYIDARPDLTPSEVTPVVVFFDYVYPKNTDTVTSVEEKTITPEEGDPYPAYVVYAGATPFVPSDVIEGETLQAQFTSGDLTSLTFKVSINYDPNTWTPEDGFDKKFEIVAQIETSGDSVSIIPNANMKPKPGDTFVLTGVKLPKQRIAEAEQELLEEGTAYAEKHSGDTNVYDCPTNPVYCAANDKSYDAGQVVILQDARFGTDGRRSRIQGYEKKLYNEYVATYTVGDNRTYSRTGKIENAVKQNIYSQRIGTTTSGAAVYLITRYDQTPATDYNAYSALRALWQFANKQTDETFKGNVSFEKDIRSSDFKKGDIAGAGYAAYKDENGDAVIEADKIVIRKEARFNQAVINQVTFQRGSTVMTLAGCKITAVEETDSAYRCHYDNKQGSQFSGFVVQDQARCQRYDATQSVIAKYYWRLVVGVGNDYVDLSKSDVDGSGIPAIGDEIVQFGNRIDATRQRAIVLDPLNGSVEVYAHIDSYSLLNRGFVGMGIDPQSQEAYIYSYGDLLAGDRNPLAEDAEYVRFTKDEGEQRRTLKIKAQVTIKPGSSGLANLAEWAEQQEKIDAMGYITKALKGSTTISGGLILTSLISLLDQDGTTKSGINGIYDPEKLGGGIAAWYGGDMADKFDYYYWDETDWTLKPKPDVEIPESMAQGVDRMDGTGYRAGGNFWWDADGNIHADPLSFFVGEETVGSLLLLFRLNYKPDTIDKPFEDVLSVTPMRPFTELKISGTQNRIYFGDTSHYIELDENGDFHFSHGVYSDSFLSALGLNPNTGGGGGGGAYDRLDAWSDYTADKAGWVLSAGLGYDLYNRVRSLEGGSALSFTTEGTGNVVTAVKKSGTAVVVTKGLTALTSHQPIYALNFQAGAFEAKKYTPNTGVQTVNVPTKTSHLSNDSGFATHLGISGNQIGTYANGVLGNLITVPYATNADTVDSLHSTDFFRRFRVSVDSGQPYDFNTLTAQGYHYNVEDLSNAELANAPVELLYGGFGVLSLSYSNYGTQIAALYSPLTRLYVRNRYYSNGNKWSTWKEVAFTESNVASATRLETPRTLWGRSFDGSEDVSGTLSYVGNINFSGSSFYIRKQGAESFILALDSSNLYVGATGGTANIGYRGTSELRFFAGAAEGNVVGTLLGTWNTTGLGIGTPTPAYKLDVSGSLRATAVRIVGSANAQNSYITSNTSTNLILYADSKALLTLDASAMQVRPAGSTANLIDLGGASHRWKGVYSNAIDASDVIHSTTGFLTEGYVQVNNRIYFKGTDHYIEIDSNGLFHFSHGVYTDGTLAARGFNNSGSTLSLWGNIYDGKSSIDGVIRSIYAADPANGTIIGKFLAKKSDPLGLILRTYTTGATSIQSQREDDDSERFVLSLNPLGGNVAINKTSAAYALDVAGTINTSGNIIATGTVTAKDFIKPSDARLKTYMEDIELTVSDIANAPAWRYKWKSDESIDVGSTTQYWGAKIPEVTHKLPDGKHFGLDYGKTALLSVISVARTVQSHEERITALEDEKAQRITELERENEQLKQTLKKYIS